MLQKRQQYTEQLADDFAEMQLFEEQNRCLQKKLDEHREIRNDKEV